MAYCQSDYDAIDIYRTHKHCDCVCCQRAREILMIEDRHLMPHMARRCDTVETVDIADTS